MGASIDEALSISHFIGIVIGRGAVIGKNFYVIGKNFYVIGKKFYVKQNVTIGVRHAGQTGKIYIGDNVEVGANSCIIGNDISIGYNVVIGEMTFVNKTFLTTKSLLIKERSLSYHIHKALRSNIVHLSFTLSDEAFFTNHHSVKPSRTRSEQRSAKSSRELTLSPLSGILPRL